MAKRVRGGDGFVDACSFGSLLAGIPDDLVSHGYFGAVMALSAGEQPGLRFVIQLPIRLDGVRPPGIGVRASGGAGGACPPSR